MTRFGNAFGLIVAVMLTACSAGEKPRAADVVAPSLGYQDFGDLRVHHNVLPTLSISSQVATEYGVERDANRAMITIALRSVVNGEESPAEGEVRAAAVDLQGTRQAIPMKAVRTGEYTDYIGTFNIAARDSYRFEVAVQSKGRAATLKFQRNF